MQIYDVLMLVVLVAATIFGMWKGMAWQIASLASLVLSYFIALQFADQLAPKFAGIAPPPLNKFVAMLAIYMATSFVIWNLFRFVSGVDRPSETRKLRPPDGWASSDSPRESCSAPRSPSSPCRCCPNPRRPKSSPRRPGTTSSNLSTKPTPSFPRDSRGHRALFAQDQPATRPQRPTRLRARFSGERQPGGRLPIVANFDRCETEFHLAGSADLDAASRLATSAAAAPTCANPGLSISGTANSRRLLSRVGGHGTRGSGRCLFSQEKALENEHNTDYRTFPGALAGRRKPASPLLCETSGVTISLPVLRSTR